MPEIEDILMYGEYIRTENNLEVYYYHGKEYYVNVDNAEVF
jgi:hypothetical protein